MIREDICFDFNDLLIIPRTTTRINSRYDEINLPFSLPIMTAPMDTVVNLRNAHLFKNYGIGVIIPRTEIQNEYDYVNKFLFINEKGYFMSLGMDMFKKLTTYNKDWLPKKVLLDVANGHIENILTQCRKIKNINPKIEIMVGSIANPETYKYYARSGVVDYVRCGIGAGGGCLTTKHSGIGMPMASLIYECSEIKKELQKENPHQKLPFIVADGGMKDYADIIKALGLGADYVLLGSILNRALESAGKNVFCGVKISQNLAKKLMKRGFVVKKHFRGMSTKEAQKAMGKTKLKTSEGVVRYRPIKYTLSGWVENFIHYLRNNMSYSNASNLDEFIGKADFCKITDFSYKRFDK